jgi:hypothetical protein
MTAAALAITCLVLAVAWNYWYFTRPRGPEFDAADMIVWTCGACGRRMITHKADTPVLAKCQRCRQREEIRKNNGGSQ